ncbi:OLC1v1011603C1 [Oldenlandia corymbosa var. corymbosa]|uniref:OLC1v1011603C1 n=1 Tax=Oldenlandia corymbosa var. corymbosa TaxID=529605 RepID=A0AAV1DX19_OLDCO|nr:OLC1v1011603C1 [Oldenlandia corymbosa var. corymbosa]
MVDGRRRRSLQFWWLMFWANITLLHSCLEQREGVARGVALASAPAVKLLVEDDQVIMQNGIVKLTLSTPKGRVLGISYNGVENLLETRHHEKYRGYWDLVWGRHETTDLLEATRYNVVMETEDQVEISFTRKWNVSLGHRMAPLNVDKRFVTLRGSPGFYTYAVLERPNRAPAFDLKELRVVLKLESDKFHYMAISDRKQRLMPMPEDRRTGRKLDYSEAVLLTKPINPQFKGEVDDKYFYSVDNIANRVYGWVRSDPSIGFWMITPSDEFRTGGPFKQDLTTHVGPNLLNMFVSGHYAGDDLALKFKNGEAWKKVFGPVFVYLNSHNNSKNTPYSLLWNDAKQQMLNEVLKWPYTFPHSPDFVKPYKRARVSGQILVHDWYSF